MANQGKRFVVITNHLEHVYDDRRKSRAELGQRAGMTSAPRSQASAVVDEVTAEGSGET